jgi:SAM-dependent methyltransferase
MNDWTAGYIADVDYTYGYYDEMNPQRVPLAFLKAGLVYPKIETACELGFGQGFGVNILAASSDIEWHGTDFNPAHASYARELAGISGANLQVNDQSFEEFCHREDLPDFDFIALHGVWSWISDANRAIIVDFLRRKLKLGGILYISYNTLPGWSSFIPLRNLMMEHYLRLGAQGKGTNERVSGAIEFAQQLLATDPVHAKAHPLIGERMKKLAEQNPDYLAHEYFNADWHPMDFNAMENWLAPAKLSFACSASYLDHIDALRHSPEQSALLKEIPDQGVREATRDIMVNQQFRRDYWVKGARSLTPLEQAERLRDQQVQLVRPPQDVAYKVKSPLGEANLSEKVYQPIVEALADYKPVDMAELEQRVKSAEVNIGQLFEAIIVLIGDNVVAPVRSDSSAEPALQTSRNINDHLLDLARSRSDTAHMSSPTTGGGVPCSRFERLFLLAMQAGKKKPAQWAESAWQTLSSQGQLMIQEGKTLTTPEENQAALLELAEKFADQRLALLKATQVAEK